MLNNYAASFGTGDSNGSGYAWDNNGQGNIYENNQLTRATPRRDVHLRQLLRASSDMHRRERRRPSPSPSGSSATAGGTSGQHAIAATPRPSDGASNVYGSNVANTNTSASGNLGGHPRRVSRPASPSSGASRPRAVRRHITDYKGWRWGHGRPGLRRRSTSSQTPSDSQFPVGGCRSGSANEAWLDGAWSVGAASAHPGGCQRPHGRWQRQIHQEHHQPDQTWMVPRHQERRRGRQLRPVLSR